MNTLMTRRRVDEWDRYGYPTGKWHWSRWTILGNVPPGGAAQALAYWQDLNAYAVRERGPRNTAREYRVVEGHIEDWERWETPG